ncbi:MAG: DUF4118 domain-containing protein [Pseudomonadota bacterium]
MLNKRSDPDRLLAEIKEEASAAKRGKLKIFFGACAGVGKTCAMLRAAQQALSEGLDVLVGVVETHGRSETAELLATLPQLPLLSVTYRAHQVSEFDLDAALQRAPQLILIDELAHSNVSGCRHAKRWQDVELLLARGIDVYGTLNVQHLDSLNEVVGRITGVRVWETVPDRFFEQASEINLVDLPPDDLLQRLKEGKVYLPEQAAQAAQNFFRKGNLIALRELALRRTADRVDGQMRAYRAERAIKHVWPAHERLIVCIGPGLFGAQWVRSAARLASELKADWLCVYVETPALQRLAKTERQRILDYLRLAESLGAETATLGGHDAIATLLAYARSRNANKLLVGRPQALPWYLAWRPRFVDALTRQASDIDIYVIGLAVHAEPQRPAARLPRIPWQHYAWATLACACTALLATPLLHVFDLSNVVMLFLLTVMGVAIRGGRGPGAWAAACSVSLFDFFFVPPRFSFSVADAQYLFTFALMLAVALIIGQLAAQLRFGATIAHLRAHRAQELAALSKELSAALSAEQVVDTAHRHLSGVFRSQVAILLPDQHEKIQIAASSAESSKVDTAVAQWVYDQQQVAGLGTQTLSAAAAHYLPLKAPMRTRGVLVLAPPAMQLIEEPEEKRLLDTFAAQIALALERVHYVAVAQDVLVSMEGERLRNALLAAVSHDLRTPLTVLIGLSSTLLERDPPLAIRQELARSIQQEAQQMSELLSNLLDMARLQVGGIHLKKDWQSLEEIIGSACAQMTQVLGGHLLRVTVPADLPLCECDPILLQRVLVNLLDNAVKFTPPGSHIKLSARSQQTSMLIVVEDDGPGLPLESMPKLFEKFTRGESESNKPGVGLGLALCKAIVEAHAGTISAENCASGGARFSVSLPLGLAPELDTRL